MATDPRFGRRPDLLDGDTAGSGDSYKRERDLLGEYRTEADRLNAENEASRLRGENFMMDAFKANSGSTFSEDDLNKLFAAQADVGLEQLGGNIGALTNSLGIRGVSGGIGADLAVQAHGDFQRVLAQTKGNLRVAKIQADAADKTRNLGAAFSLGNYIGAPHDETKLFGIEGMFSGLLGLEGLNMQRDAIDAQREATRSASDNAEFGAWTGLFGDILGAFLPGL